MRLFRTAFLFTVLIAAAVVFSATPVLAGFVYVATDSATANMIYGFSVNETTGELTALSGFPVATGYIGSGFTNLELTTIDPLNKRLYVGNRGSSNVSAYSIDTTTGALTPMPFSPIATVANERTLKVHPSGSPLIIGADTFASFVITSTTATAAPGSPYAMPTGVSPSVSTLTPDGSYYYAGGNSGNFFGGYAINSATGEMTALPGNPFDSGSTNPVPTATDSAGRLYLSSSRQALARVYTLSAGVPTAVTGSPFSMTETGFAAVGRIAPTGNFWVQPNRTRNHLYSIAISGSGAATSLSVVSGSPFVTGGTTSLTMVFNAAGDNIFVANGGTRNITRFAFNPATGVLSDQAVQAVNTLGTDGSVSGISYIASSPASVPVSIGGRLVSGNTLGVRATVTIENSVGIVQTTLASPLGYYRFDHIASGTEYTIRAKSKMADFTPRTLTPAADVLDFDITAAVSRAIMTISR
ncbi:MAG: hypothetical protein ABJA02_10860 [Acidobacteriota bacterium]